MQPKPLSKEERFQVLNAKARGNADMLWAIDRALAAEQFWREAVKNAPHYQGHNGHCQWCKMGHRATGDDAPDCPWLLAQEE